MLEQYSCKCVNYQQNDWVFWLALAEYFYNDNVYSATRVSLFEALFNEKQSWDSDLIKKQDLNVFTAHKQAVDLMAIYKFVEKQLAKTAATQAKHYNTKHFLRVYNVGEFVYLNSKNIKSTQPTKKLDYKYYRPYWVLD